MSGIMCPECSNASVKKYEFGGFWCGNCLAWYTTREIEIAHVRMQAGLSLRTKQTLKVEH